MCHYYGTWGGTEENHANDSNASRADSNETAPATPKPGKRSPAHEAIRQAAKDIRAAIFEDVERVAEQESWAGVSVKTITGHTPLCEIRTGRYRTFFDEERSHMGPALL